MSLVPHCRVVSGGALGVVGSRCLGCAGIALRVSGPSPFAAPSLCCSAPLTELRPQFHAGAGSCRHSVRFSCEGGNRDRSSFPWLLQPSLCDSQGHRWVATGDRPLAPQRLGGCLPFPHGDHSNRSPVSPGGGLDGIPGSPGCLPPGSGASISSPVPEVLRGGVGLPVSCPLLWSVDGSTSIHPRHGSCLIDNASSQVPHPPVPRRLARPGFVLPGDCAGEGLPPLTLLSPRYHDQCSQELCGSESDSGLSRNDNLDFSFEGFPDPQKGSEIVSSPSGVSLRAPTSCVSVASPLGGHVLDVGSSPGCSSPYAIPPA